MVGEHALRGLNPDVIDAILSQHALGDFAAGDGHRLLRVFGKRAFHLRADQLADEHREAGDDEVDRIVSSGSYGIAW